jgi:transcriptional regulator with XRE-family HTH domain
MEKQEQSFTFSESSSRPAATEEKRKVVSLSSATKLTPVPANNIDTAQVITAHTPKAVKAVPLAGKIVTSLPDENSAVKKAKAVTLTPVPEDDEPVKVAKAVTLTPVPEGDEPVKVVKAVTLTPVPEDDEPAKVVKAVTLTPVPEDDEPVKVVKAVTLTPVPEDNESVTEQINPGKKEEKITGPTRKLPIPMNKEKGIQLTDENIEHRLQKSEEKNQPDTGPTQKIPIPPSKNVRINLEAEPAKSKPVKQAAEKKVKAKDEPIAEPVNPDLDIKFGKYLKDARNAKKMSLAEVENKTKIRKNYIEALESENFVDLPPIIYVCAYVKNLCLSYEIDNDTREKILAELKKLLPTHLSNETIQNLNIDCEIDEAEEHKLNIIVTTILVVIILACLVTAVSIWLLNSGDSPQQTATSSGQTTKFERSKLIELSPHQSVKMTVLDPDFKTTNSK